MVLDCDKLAAGSPNQLEQAIYEFNLAIFEYIISS
jgi:hypothetical protein